MDLVRLVQHGVRGRYESEIKSRVRAQGSSVHRSRGLTPKPQTESELVRLGSEVGYDPEFARAPSLGT